MTDKTTKGGPSPDPGHRGSGPSGSHLVPEGAKARFTGSRRGQYPKGSVPKPGQRVRPAPSGSSQENTMTYNPVPPVATHEGGGHGKPAGSRKSPYPTKGGKGRSKL